jgi:oxygen-independent coproporphyrinogen-3 oxidase
MLSDILPGETAAGGRREAVMDQTCDLKPECPRLPKRPPAALVAKYGVRVPRYTSYPSAAQFTADVVESDHRAWLGSLDSRALVSLYVHIPFCDRLCWYCGCHTSVVHRRSPVEDYVETLRREIRLVRAALPARLTATALHFGGGTPNMLSPEDLQGLVEELRATFEFDDTFELAAELDPRILTSEWIDNAAQLGLNRASLGVQDLDPDVQAAINRRQPFAQIDWAVQRLRRAGAASINLDLMYGLPKQTTASVLATLEQILVLAPERIALFGYAHVPWMKPHQKLLPEAELPDADARYDQQNAAAERLEKAGYVRIGLDHFAKPNDDLAVALRRGALRRNFQGYTSDRAGTLLGFGASSISAFPQGYVQNAARVPQWKESIETGRLATARGLAVGPHERLRGAIIERLMCDFEVDIARLCAAAGKPLSTFAPELFRLREMESDGLLRRRGARIEVTAAGRPFIRTIASTFDPHSQPSRHVAAV